MQLKTITGASIHAALAEARRLLGDDVVLLESVPPQGEELARITVMVDAEEQGPEQAPEPALAGAAGYGYRAARPAAGARPGTEESARSAESFSPKSGLMSGGADAAEDRYVPSRATARGRLFPGVAEAVSKPAPATSPSDRLEKLVEGQLKLLHRRLDAMERRFEQAVIGSSQRWGAHPLFGALLDQGIRPATVARLFDAVAAEGYAPDDDATKLRWALAQQLRRAISVPATKMTATTQVFVGPSGAGKTSLLLKLATHPSFFARSTTSVIVIAPDQDDLPYQSPVELYRHYGIPVQSVRTEEEMHDALRRLDAFDHVLIDTPPMPASEAGARRVLHRVARFVQGLMPIDVHFVMNATRALDRFDADFVHRLPLRPSTVALTHLDETLGWGRVAEWLMALELPVRYVSTGPEAPDGLQAYSPTWFVENVMAL